MEKTSILQDIDKTLIVQERDCRIARCKNEVNDIPAKKEAITKNIDRYHNALNIAKDTSKIKQAEIHKLDVEIEASRQQIAKLREQQFQIKSNNEYKALDHEIAHVEKAIKKLEDREIEIMEEVEQAKTNTARLQSELEQGESTINQELQQLEMRRKNLESEINQIKADREKLAGEIDQTFLTHYNRVMTNKQDVALVRLENGSCGGCHMKLPAHVAHDVRKALFIVTCNFCGRILYSKPSYFKK